MINGIWCGMIIIGVIVSIFTGKIQAVTDSAISSAGTAVEISIGLVGVMALWLGLMKIAEEAGLVKAMGKAMKPLMIKLFPEVPADHPAMGSMVANMAANFFGLGNAATPFGIKAMEEMDRLNTKKGVASNDMALFLVLNAACIQLVPSTVLSIRAAAGSTNPGAIILPAIISTGTAAIVGVICCKILQRYF